jgi:hypothetical protein
MFAAGWYTQLLLRGVGFENYLGQQNKNNFFFLQNKENCIVQFHAKPWKAK